MSFHDADPAVNLLGCVVGDIRPQRSPLPPDLLIARLAEGQHGVATRRQLLRAGLDPDRIRRRIARGSLHRLHRGVYAVGARGGGWEQHLMAAVLACGPGAALSHRSGAQHLRVLPAPAPPWGDVDVTAPRSCRPRPGIVLHRPRRLLPGDVSVHLGIPVCVAPRVLVDLAAVLEDEDELEEALRQARRRRLLDPRAMRAQLDRGRTGTASARRLLDPDRPDLRRELERRFHRFLLAGRYPPPVTNEQIRTPLGPLVADAVWHDARFIVELDSWRHHAGRDAFETDRERDIAAELAGYATRRITWRMLTRTPDVVRAVLDQRLVAR